MAFQPEAFIARLPRRRILHVAGLALALAALPGPSPSRDASRLRLEVAAALTSSPAIPGRLADVPYHGRISRRPRAESDPRAFARLARVIASDLAARPSPRTRAAMALVELTTGRPDAAVRLLEAAVAASPSGTARAGFLNDLAVTHLARSASLDEPHDLAYALDAASAALDANPALHAACFNRALALEQLLLVAQATATWQRCAQGEPDAGWRAEIDRHLSALTWPPADDAPTTSDVLEQVLPRWADALLAGHAAEASNVAAQGRKIGEALARSGDFTVADVFARIERDAAGADGRARLADLAQGSRHYRQARRDFAAYRTDQAQPEFAAATRSFARAGSPLVAWAELGSIGVDFYRDAFVTVFDRLHALRPAIDENRYPLLAARWHWIHGMTHSRQGDLRATLRDFETTVAFYQRSHDREGLGAGYQLVGEVYRVLGDEDAAWRYRMRGLLLLRTTPRSLRRLLLLRDAAESLLAEGLSHAALAVQDEAVFAAAGAVGARDSAEMLLWRARVNTQLGRSEHAVADLERARALAARVDSLDLRDRALADIDFAGADLAAETDPSRALTLFAAPAAAYERKGHVLALSTLLLHRARVARGLHLPGQEQADLTAGIELFERQWGSLDTDADRVAFLATAQELYDAAIGLKIEAGDAAAALELSERSRAFWTGAPGSLDASWVRVAAAPRGTRRGSSRALPDDLAVLEFASIGDRLFLWQITGRGLRLSTLAVSENSIARLAADFRAAAQGDDGAAERFAANAETAYDLLLRDGLSGIPSHAKLVVVPDRALYGIPFAALRDRTSGHCLIEDHQLVLAPSATFLTAVGRRPPRAHLEDDVLLASPLDPELTESAAEIADLRALYPGAETLTGRQLGRDQLLAALDTHRIFHYAGHAEVHPANPFLSRLPLSQSPEGEALTMRDLADRTFARLDLVILSSCSSLSAAPTRTGGFLGLARPFLSGGARTVVGTLWKVDDAVSRAILVTFHEQLRAGLAPAAALRAAQIYHLQQGMPPSAWAAFAVMGSGGE